MVNGKDQLRKKILAERKKLDKAQVDTLSNQITQTLIDSELYKQAKNIMTYVSYPN